MTAGNSTPLSDGASAVLLGSEEWGAERGLAVLARFVDAETAAVDHVGGRDGLLMAPAYAVPRLLARNVLTLQDFDLYEIHEAFAAQVALTLAAGGPVFAHERLGLDAPPGRSTGPSSTFAADRSPRAILRGDRRQDRRQPGEAAQRAWGGRG